MAFGRQGLDLDLPGDAEVSVVRKPPMPVPPDAVAAVRAAFDAPVGSPRLEEAARGCRTACILVCDITRPVPNALLLRPIVERLGAGGIDAGRITVLVATGLHRPNEGRELEEVIGDPWVQGRCRVENHEAQRDADHVDLGATSGGIPVSIDRRLVEADVRIAVGLVEPHFMAGWSGGRKLIAPGVSHAQTIAGLHAARLLSHPQAATCILDGNPVHAAQLEIADRVGPVLGLNVVIDERRRLCFASFGGLAESHAAAVAFAAPHFRVPVSRRFPIVVSSAAGWPLDATYYQTVKGMVAAVPILQPGGELLVVSECSEGFGSAGFRRSQEQLRAMGAEAFLASAGAKARAEADEWQAVMLLKALAAGRVSLYAPGLDAAEARDACVTVVGDPSAAVREAVERCAPRSGGGRGGVPVAVAVLPEGPYVVPYVGGEEGP